MFFQRLKTPGLGHNSFVLGCGDGLAVVIDARRDVDEYLQLARKNNLTIAYVLETHWQKDFELGSRACATHRREDRRGLATSGSATRRNCKTVRRASSRLRRRPARIAYAI